IKRTLDGSYSLQKNSTVESYPLGSEPPQPESYDDNKHNYGIILGGGFDFGLGTFELRYALGLSNVENTPDGQDVKASVIRTHTGTLSVMMGFLF
ncbi:MAG: hypothetical protein HQK83_11985, partial [Fibrobacteria bacterium]|nr:hypothetical protein [Fibrobacteria bacterium]